MEVQDNRLYFSVSYSKMKGSLWICRFWRQNLDVFVAWRINMWDTCCIIERSPPVGELGFSSYSCVLQVKNLAKSTFRVCQALLIFHNTRNLEPKTNTVPAHHLIAVVNQSRALCKQTLDILVGRNLLKSFLYSFFVFFRCMNTETEAFEAIMCFHSSPSLIRRTTACPSSSEGWVKGRSAPQSRNKSQCVWYVSSRLRFDESG